jgi:hypothetical protein
MSAESTIFIPIAAYRDAEIYPTVRDLFAKATHPERLHVAVCWQYDVVNDKPLDFEEFRDRVSIINMDCRKSRGLCWIRQLVHKLYGGETYYLQVDAHSRFIPGWDKAMIAELLRCPSEKPIISTYPDRYLLPNELCDWGPYKIGFMDGYEGVPNLCSRECTPAEREEPSHSAVAAGGFTFAHGTLLLDVPQDPLVYFIGEEVLMSVRYWTHGYDIFTPTRILMYHLYVANHPDKPLHWNDNPDWHSSYQSRAGARVRHMLGIEPSTDPWVLERIEQFGFGQQRTLAQYEAFAGIRFRDHYYSEDAKNGIVNLTMLPVGPAAA